MLGFGGRRVVRVMSLAAVTAALVVGMAAPATASDQPDISVSKHKSGPYKGKDFIDYYFPAGPEQQLFRSIRPGKKRDFYTKAVPYLEEEGCHRLFGPSGSSQITIRYYRMFRNPDSWYEITAAVTGDGSAFCFGFPEDDGKPILFRTRAKAKSSATPGHLLSMSHAACSTSAHCDWAQFGIGVV